ncbi:MAG: biopolymer transporter ExbD [SAR324 cluster bacterium]|nr:biopolymer transporter ExbD [SAR324 cluster bacterium]
MPAPWEDDEMMSDINVTPFVDVLLVLLVIFMITAPIIHQIVQVDLPEDSYSKDGASLDKTLRIIIDQNGLIYINNDLIGKGLSGKNQETFQQRIEEWTHNKNGSLFVDIEADEQSKYGMIVPVIARLKEMNISLNLVIDPLSKQ